MDEARKNMTLLEVVRERLIEIEKQRKKIEEEEKLQAGGVQLKLPL